MSSLYTRANTTRPGSARSRLLRFHLTTGPCRIPPLLVMFFPDRICSICKPVISVNHSLSTMCFLLPGVRMCLHCCVRQRLWLTSVSSSVLAATETAGRLRAHLSHLYHEINGGTHEGRRRLIVAEIIHLPSQSFMLICIVAVGNLHLPLSLTCGTTLYPGRIGSDNVCECRCVCVCVCAYSAMEGTEMLMEF